MSRDYVFPYLRISQYYGIPYKDVLAVAHFWTYNNGGQPNIGGNSHANEAIALAVRFMRILKDGSCQLTPENCHASVWAWIEDCWDLKNETE